MAILKRALLVLAIAGFAAALVPATGRATPARVRDLTIHQGDMPRRLLGYGLVVGLDGTGDRSFGGVSSNSPTVHSVVNLLRRFDIEVPAYYLRLRNVAAVLVTAETSPYLRAGGRFEVQVSALGDATSLEGGVLWITPLVTDPDQPPQATAQGPVLVTMDEDERASVFARRGNSGRIPEGGLLEVDPPSAPAAEPRLLLRRPDWVTAQNIAAAINQNLGDGTAVLEDPGSIKLALPGDAGPETLAQIDLIEVDAESASRIVIHGNTGMVVAGGDARVGPATIHHHGITLQIGGTEPGAGTGSPGYVQVEPQALVQDVAAGLHAAGARPAEIAAIFEALRDAGALNAEVLIR